MNEMLEPSGISVPLSALRSRRAQQVATLLEREAIAFASLVDVRASDANDVVVFDVEVERGQRLVHKIERVERIAVTFDAADEKMPEALVLRSTFPRVPHLNLRLEEFPRSLCLYDEPFDEIRSRWTAPTYVERIRTWLALTARGKLHAADQPLEPLLYGHAGHVILPADLSSCSTSDDLVLTATSLEPGSAVLQIHRANHAPMGHGVDIIVSMHGCKPQAHGVITSRPATLEQLADFTADAGLDLLDKIRTRIRQGKDSCADKDAEVRFLKSTLLVLINFPKTRTTGGAAETADLWAFLTTQSLKKVGIEIGLWTEIDADLGYEFSPPADRRGGAIQLDLLDPVFGLTRERAAVLNGDQPRDHEPRIVAIGAGALGSQVEINLARAGFGQWTIVDHDRVFPHNLARHSLSGNEVGHRKSECVAYYANSLNEDAPAFEFKAVNVLRPGNQADELGKLLGEAHAILDMSASVAVARHLCHDIDSTARRASYFLSPSGSDSVLLVEDAARSAPLDALEMQFYRALVRDEGLHGHFEIDPGARLRYGQSCRDVTSRLPQHLVALHAAIGSRAIRERITKTDAGISVWRAEANLSVRHVAVQPHAVRRFDVGDWSFCIDDATIASLHEQRSQKLPKETGGVLIGTFDHHRRIAYVVDTIPSPPDSEEWPTLYIRGARGLSRRVEQITRITDGTLQYVGEWHSHPVGCSTRPSNDDLKVFAWLTERMDADGLPALMMIVGDPGNISCFLGCMKPIENLIPHPKNER